MSSLGTLFVDLKAETGGFVSALSKAAASAEQASRQISREFSGLQRVASQTFGAFGDFNPAISQISFALSAAGSAASSAMKALDGVGGAIGPIASLGAGAAAGLAAIGVGAIGLAARAADAAAKMYELAQSTGVPVETLSAFSYAAKAAGVDSQTLALGLERMSKSALAAATAPAGATNVYTQLGVAVRDAAGNIRPAQDILLDLADKFSRMPDGVLKSAEAIAIFGRNGDAMIPFMNRGKEGIADLVDYAKQVGAVLSGPAAEASEEFSTSLVKIGIAAAGAQNTLMAELLPALNAITEAMKQGAAENSSNVGDFIKGISEIAKIFLAVGDTIFTALANIGVYLAAQITAWEEEFVGLAKVASKALVFDYGGAIAAAKDSYARLSAIDKDYLDHRAQMWADNDKFIKTVFGELKPPQASLPKPTGGPGAPAAAGAPQASGRPDVVSELIGSLQAQAAAELALAAATEKSAAASVLAKASAEAETKIGETRARLLEQEKQLQGELADAQAEASAGVGSTGATGAGGPGVRATKIQAEIAGIQAMLAELQKDAPQIKSLYSEIASGEFGAKASKDLEEFITKTDEETAALQRMAAAYAQGPAAAQGAEEAAKLAPFEKQRADLGQLIVGLKAIGAPAADIALLQTAFDQLTASIERAKTSEAAFVAAQISEKIAKEKEELAAQAQAYAVVAQAALKSAAAQREAAAQAAAIKFGAENPTATPADLSQVYSNALATLNEQRAETIAQTAAQYDLNASFSQELEKLQEIRSFLEASGQSTISIDNAISSARIQHVEDYQKAVFDAQNAELLGNARLYDSQQQLIEQWDQAAMKVGTLSEKLGAFFSMAEQEGANLSEKVFGAFSKTLDDLSTKLAQWVVTGKANFKELLTSLSESLLKATFQKGIGDLAGGLAKALHLPTPQKQLQLGTAANPMYVKFAGGFPPGLPGAPGGPGGSPVVDLSGGSAGDTSAFLSSLSAGTGDIPGYGSFGTGVGDTSAFSDALAKSGGTTQQGASGLSGFFKSIEKMFGLGGGDRSPGPGGTPPILPGPAYGPPAVPGVGEQDQYGNYDFKGGFGGFGNPGQEVDIAGNSPGTDDTGNYLDEIGSGGAGAGFLNIPSGAPGGGPAAASPSGAGNGSQSNPFFVVPLAAAAAGQSGGAMSMGLNAAESGLSAVQSAVKSASSTASTTALTTAATTLSTAATALTTVGATLTAAGASLTGAAAALSAAAATLSASSAAGGAGIAGALAGGGDVSSGKAYIVGEKRPEVFVPRVSGRIVPSLGEFADSFSSSASDAKNSYSSHSFSSSAAFSDSALLSALPHREHGGEVLAGNACLVGESRPEVFAPDRARSSGAGGTHYHHEDNHVELHLNGVKDYDSFKKSQAQIYAEMSMEIDRARYRNGR